LRLAAESPQPQVEGADDDELVISCQARWLELAVQPLQVRDVHDAVEQLIAAPVAFSSV